MLALRQAVSTASLRCLEQTEIDETGPGAILRDFEALVRYVGPGVRASGKYHLLPIAGLKELDAQMTRPERLPLKRPQLKSYPAITGLYLLLRATQLAVPKGQGKKTGRLELNPEVHQQWIALNATERYFTLLEVWLEVANWATLGEGHGSSANAGNDFFSMWMDLATASRSGDTVPAHSLFLYGIRQRTTLALCALFGLVALERGPGEKEGSVEIGSITPTPFGRAIAEALGVIDFDASVASRTASEYATWQEQIRVFFPEWQNSLQPPQPEFRDGVYRFKVSLADIWRRIEIPATADLEDLAQMIISAYEFDGEHLHQFRLRDPTGRELTFVKPDCDPAFPTDEVPIGGVPLGEGQSMEFLYDFGACWMFDVFLESISPMPSRTPKPRITESHGDAPPEYEYAYDYDDYDDDDE